MRTAQSNHAAPLLGPHAPCTLMPLTVVSFTALSAFTRTLKKHLRASTRFEGGGGGAAGARGSDVAQYAP